MDGTENGSVVPGLWLPSCPLKFQALLKEQISL